MNTEKPKELLERPNKRKHIDTLTCTQKKNKKSKELWNNDLIDTISSHTINDIIKPYDYQTKAAQLFINFNRGILVHDKVITSNKDIRNVCDNFI